MTEDYEQYKNLIAKTAWSFNKTTGIEFEELHSEALLAFCECMQNYDQNKGNKFSYIKTCITKHLCTFIKNMKIKKENEKSIYFIENLSNEIKKIDNEFFDSDEIISTIYQVLMTEKRPENKKGILFGWVDKRVNEILDCGFENIWNSYKQIKSILQEV